jgi:Ala-tRNA(Pro) deacylase
MSAELVRKFLMEHGIQYRTHTHPKAYTAQEVAEAEHISGDQMAKPVMLMADDALVMAVVPADHRVDLDRAKTALGAEVVRLATESEFSPSFPDCERGAEPPFGMLYNVATVVDQKLASEQITFNAGTHTTTISMARADYLDVLHPKVVDISMP